MNYRVKRNINELCSSLTPDLGSFLALWDAYCIPLPKHIQESNRIERHAACQGGEQKCSQTERAKVTKQVRDRLVTRAWRDSWLTVAALLQTCCRFTQKASGGHLCLRGYALHATASTPGKELRLIYIQLQILRRFHFGVLWGCNIRQGLESATRKPEWYKRQVRLFKTRKALILCYYYNLIAKKVCGHSDFRALKILSTLIPSYKHR